MELQDIVHRYRDRLLQSYGNGLSPDQHSALNAMGACRQGLAYGSLTLQCQACLSPGELPRSCGHRACNQCQHQSTERWLERQSQKLLPVDYYMVTFTLPYELRAFAKAHSRRVYALLFECAINTLRTFAKNKKGFEAELGLCGVLHTHTRKLDYHPHVHVIVPGGGIHRGRKEWRKVQKKYLFNGKTLAKAFRGAFLNALAKEGMAQYHTPKQWVTQCKQVGRGLEALQYLSRYLYRGVISNKNILHDDGTHVTFQYQNSETKKWETRTERGEDFLRLLMQHVLPKGFRRARDFGFLHGNAKTTLAVIQWVLKVVRPAKPDRKKVTLCCPHCTGLMVVTGIKQAKQKPG